MRQPRSFSLSLLLLNIVVLAGCSGLPYQKSMKTYVDSSQSLLVQVREVPDVTLKACSLYRDQASLLNGTNAAACNFDTIAKQASEVTTLIDAAIWYHDLIERHSPEYEEYRGLDSLANTGKVVSTECVKEGSKCNFDWISGTRLDVVQEAAEGAVKAYQATQGHEALNQYLTETEDVYPTFMGHIVSYLTSTKAIIKTIERDFDGFRVKECGKNTPSSFCENQEVQSFIEGNKERLSTLDDLINKLGQHTNAHEAFRKEVAANETSKARQEILIKFAQGVLETGYKVHEAF